MNKLYVLSLLSLFFITHAAEQEIVTQSNIETLLLREQQSRFRAGTCQNKKYENIDFTTLNFYEATTRVENHDVTLTCSPLYKINFTESTFVNCKFNMQDTVVHQPEENPLSQEQINTLSASNTNFSNCYFDTCYFEGTLKTSNISDISVEKSTFYQVEFPLDCQTISITQSNFQEGSFKDSNLTKANLSYNEFFDTSFENTLCIKTKFYNSMLSCNCKCRNANFSQADFSQADVGGTYTDAIFDKTNMINAKQLYVKGRPHPLTLEQQKNCITQSYKPQTLAQIVSAKIIQDLLQLVSAQKSLDESVVLYDHIYQTLYNTITTQPVSIAKNRTSDLPLSSTPFEIGRCNSDTITKNKRLYVNQHFTQNMQKEDHFNSIFIDCTFENISLENIDFYKSIFINTKFNNCKFYFVDLSNTKFIHSKFNTCHIDYCKINPTTTQAFKTPFNNCTITNLGFHHQYSSYYNSPNIFTLSSSIEEKKHTIVADAVYTILKGTVFNTHNAKKDIEKNALIKSLKLHNKPHIGLSFYTTTKMPFEYDPKLIGETVTADITSNID